MESFTSGIVTASQRKYYLTVLPSWKDKFKYIGHGKYRMFGWQSQIDRARWVKQFLDSNHTVCYTDWQKGINIMENYGEVAHNGKSYKLTEMAYCTSRLLPDNYREEKYFEMCASAVDEDGKNCRVYWLFQDCGQENLDEFDYDNVWKVEYEQS